MLKFVGNTIYSLLIEISSVEQGLVVYTKLDSTYNISIDENYLRITLSLADGRKIYFKREHGIKDVKILPSEINGKDGICIVKKREKCEDVITICSPKDDECCNIGESIC
jgi:CTP-dependent riboflavin kinase